TGGGEDGTSWRGLRGFPRVTRWLFPATLVRHGQGHRPGKDVSTVGPESAGPEILQVREGEALHGPAACTGTDLLVLPCHSAAGSPGSVRVTAGVRTCATR